MPGNTGPSRQNHGQKRLPIVSPAQKRQRSQLAKQTKNKKRRQDNAKALAEAKKKKRKEDDATALAEAEEKKKKEDQKKADAKEKKRKEDDATALAEAKKKKKEEKKKKKEDQKKADADKAEALADAEAKAKAVRHRVTAKEKEQKFHNKEEIEKVLQDHYPGTIYNLDHMVDAIIALSQTGADQLYANAVLVGELIRKGAPSIPYKYLPPHVALMFMELEDNLRPKEANGGQGYFRLLSRDDLSKKMKGNKKNVGAYNFLACWKSFESHVKGLEKFTCKGWETTFKYAKSYLLAVEWYKDCGFFSSEIAVKKKHVPRGQLSMYYFLKFDDEVKKELYAKEFASMDAALNRYFGLMSLRDIVQNESNLIKGLNNGYALSLSNNARGTSGVLVIGMSNFGSEFAVEQIKKMNKEMAIPVFTLASNKACKKSWDSVSDDIREAREAIMGNNLWLNSDSRCLLAKMSRKFGSKVVFKSVYLDHNAVERMKDAQESMLKELYNVTIPLLRKSGMLSDNCEILLPFNATTVYYLHKSQDQVKKYANVSFLSDLKDNAWYVSMSANASKAIKKKDSAKIELPFPHQLNISRDHLRDGLRERIAQESGAAKAKNAGKRKSGSGDVADSPHIIELKKAAKRWEGYDTSEIENVKWIQLKLSTENTKKFVWPECGNQTGNNEVEPVDIELQCKRMKKETFMSYATGSPLNITINFKGGESVTVGQITLDDTNNTVIPTIEEDNIESEDDS